MPRVTFPAYCQRRNQLHATWRYAAGNFVMLSAAEQWALHDFYRFTESLGDDRLRQHWDNMLAAGSSLPHRAGRAYMTMLPYIVEAPVKVVSMQQEKPKRRKKACRVFRVESLVRPQVDVDKLVKVLMGVAMSEEDERMSSRKF